MSQTILLFGGTGQVGNACRGRFEKRADEFTVVAPGRADVDFTDPQSVRECVLTSGCDWVINACAYTAVDKAESEADIAYKINADSVDEMAKAAAQLGVPLVHISTDYVFDGTANMPYTEDQPTGPNGVYGASKLAGEQAVQKACQQYYLLRTSWVFSADGNNFVKTMLRLAKDRTELGVVADQLGRPTFAGDIADAILRLIDLPRNQQAQSWGVYHCSSQGEASWFDFAKAIFAQGVADGLIEKIPNANPLTTDQYPTPAKRPAYSVLATDKLEALIGKLPHWQKGLETTCEALKASSAS